MKLSAYYALVLLLLLFFGACTQTAKITHRPLSKSEKKDSVRDDELRYPIEHRHLVLSQRAVIRPIYVETVKNVKAKHKGYMIHVSLKNVAVFTSYKAIKLEIAYFSDKGGLLDKENLEINKLIKANTIIKIDRKVLRYLNSSYQVKLVSAAGVAN